MALNAAKKAQKKAGKHFCFLPLYSAPHNDIELGVSFTRFFYRYILIARPEGFALVPYYFKAFRLRRYYFSIYTL